MTIQTKTPQPGEIYQLLSCGAFVLIISKTHTGYITYLQFGSQWTTIHRKKILSAYKDFSLASGWKLLC